MLRLCPILLCAAVLSVLMAVEARAADPAALTVMTYNLKNANSQRPYGWDVRRPIARAMLEKHAPDLVGTQEGLYRQIKHLAADLPNYGWVGLGRDGGSRGEFMAVFYKRERLEPLEFDHFWLSDTPETVGSTSWGNSNRRMVTWVRFLDRKTERQFYFMNTHFDHEIPEARRKSADLLLQRVGRLNKELPVILVGDFNSLPDQAEVYDRLVGDGRFADTWTTAEERGEAVDTFHGYRGQRSTGRRIDWILTRGPILARSSKVVTFSRDDRYPSDHFPVVAVLGLE